jgi:hypothetical protein
MEIDEGRSTVLFRGKVSFYRVVRLGSLDVGMAYLLSTVA